MESLAELHRLRALNTQLAQQYLELAQSALTLARARLDSPGDHNHEREHLHQICQNAAESALKGFLVFWGETPTSNVSIDVMELLNRSARIEPAYLTWLDCAKRLSAGSVDYNARIAEAWEDAEIIVRQTLAFCSSDSADSSF